MSPLSLHYPVVALRLPLDNLCALHHACQCAFPRRHMRLDNEERGVSLARLCFALVQAVRRGFTGEER